jgi:hypothetical protein
VRRLLAHLCYYIDSSFLPSHSTGDTIDKLDFDRMADFARATIGWVLEVGSS